MRGQLCFCDHSLLFLALAIWHKLCPLHDMYSPIPQLHGFSSSHVWMWELDYKKSWALNWCFWNVVLKNTLESPLDCKEIQPVNPSGNQCWISLEGLMLKLKIQYLGHLMQRTDSLEKPLMLGKTEGRRRRSWQGMRWLNGWTWLSNSTEISWTDPATHTHPNSACGFLISCFTLQRYSSKVSPKLS